jgi:hypothetical protein
VAPALVTQSAAQWRNRTCTTGSVQGIINVHPVFPTTIGDFVEFRKDDRWYRLLLHSDDMWVIHQRGVAGDDFQLVVTNRRAGLMDVEGRGHLGPVTALGATEGMLFGKLF